MYLYANGCSMTYGSELHDDPATQVCTDHEYRWRYSWPGRLRGLPGRLNVLILARRLDVLVLAWRLNVLILPRGLDVLILAWRLDILVLAWRLDVLVLARRTNVLRRAQTGGQ